MEIYIALGLLCGAVTFTTSTTSIFKGVRELLSKIHPKVDELVHCPWCSNFWLSLIILTTSSWPLLNVFKYYYLDLFCTVFLVCAISGLLHYVLLRAYAPVAEAMMMRHREKEQAKREKQSK